MNCLGHASPVVTRALTEQAAKLVNPSASFHNAPSIELARRVVEASVFDRVFFANSGAEPKVPGFPKAKLNDLGSVERLITDQTVAVMVEPIQGEAGVIPASGRSQNRYSITSLACISSSCGMVSPSTLAALRFMTKSNLVGSSTGISAGFAPFRILSTWRAACRNISTSFVP